MPTPPIDLPFVHDNEIQRLVADTIAPARTEGRDAPNREPLPSPWFADEARGVRLYHGDSMELLTRMRPASIDMVFADPPYFLSGDGITCQAGRMVSVNKGIWDRPKTFEAIHEFNKEWLRACHDLLKPNGTIWVSGTMHNIYSVGFAMQTLGYKVLNDIAWHKTNPPPHLACRYFTHAHETILWARKSPSARHRFNYAEMKADNNNKQMQSVWKMGAPTTPEKRHGKHPTQKPEALLDRIIRASSNQGDLILDPFNGGGTTGVVAARLGRRFVGIELDEEFLQLTKRRITDELSARSLFSATDNVDVSRCTNDGGGKWHLSPSTNLAMGLRVSKRRSHGLLRRCKITTTPPSTWIGTKFTPTSLGTDASCFCLVPFAMRPIKSVRRTSC